MIEKLKETYNIAQQKPQNLLTNLNSYSRGARDSKNGKSGGKVAEF